MARKTETSISLYEIKPVKFSVVIEGDTDLILNKPNAPYIRECEAKSEGKAMPQEKPDPWECIITSIHWYNGEPTVFTEEEFIRNLDPKVNAPCISSFGLKKSFMDAVVRNEIDKYSTKFRANVNVLGKDSHVPIEFAEHYIDKKPIPPKKGSGHIISTMNRFTGWSAEVPISMLQKVFSIEQVINIINLAGFGIGIGSGRSSGYGRYHVVDVRQSV